MCVLNMGLIVPQGSIKSGMVTVITQIIIINLIYVNDDINNNNNTFFYMSSEERY